MRYLLAILFLATVARANDFLPFQVDGNNNVSFPTNINSAGGLTVTGGGGVNATVARIDGAGFKWYGTNVPPGFTNYLGIHGGLGAHDLFGNWFVVSTNGYVEYSNAATQVQILINTTNTAGQITIISPSSTNLFSFPTNKNNAPTWNGMNLQTNSSGGSVPNNLLTNTASAAATLIVTNSGSVGGVGFTNGAIGTTYYFTNALNGYSAATNSVPPGFNIITAGWWLLCTNFDTATLYTTNDIVYPDRVNGAAANEPHKGNLACSLGLSINAGTNIIVGGVQVAFNSTAAGKLALIAKGGASEAQINNVTNFLLVTFGRNY